MAADRIGNAWTGPAHGAAPNLVVMHAKVAIGASGAPTLTGDPGIAISRSSGGNYDLTFPKGFKSKVFVYIDKSSTLAAVRGSTATVPGSGTHSFQTMTVAGPLTVADPANGDVLSILIVGHKTA